MNEINQSILDKMKNLIAQSKSIAVLPLGNYDSDTFSAAVGLYNLLLDQGKEAHFVFTNEITENVDDIINKDDIISAVKNKELLVSIDYSGTEAAAAHYSAEGNVLQVRISPVPKDFPKVGKVSAKLVGFEADTAIILGDGDIDTSYEFLENADIIKISNGANGEDNEFKLLIRDNSCESLSHLVFKLASRLGFVPNNKSSKALLKGMSN